jgi:hypothetical protein
MKCQQIPGTPTDVTYVSSAGIYKQKTQHPFIMGDMAGCAWLSPLA